MRKMLITGASGSIGMPIVRELYSKANYEIYVTTTGRKEVEFPEGVNVVTANLLIRDQSIRLIEDIQPEVMIHLAWKVSEPGYMTSKSNLLWLEDSLFILRKFIELGGKYFAFAGSCSEYGQFRGHTENDDARNMSLYGQCKNSFHKTAQSLCSNSGVDYVNLRFFNTPGGGFMTRVAEAVEAFAAGEEFTCRYHPFSIFDYTCCDDAARAACEIILRQYIGVVNIGSGIPRVMNDVFKTVAKKMDAEHLLHFDYEMENLEIQLANTNVLNKIIGFETATDFDETLEYMIASAGKEA